MKSEAMQKTAPPRNEAGSTSCGLLVQSRRWIKNGAATPTNETGPAKAVTVAASRLARRIKSVRSRMTLTPRLSA